VKLKKGAIYQFVTSLDSIPFVFYSLDDKKCFFKESGIFVVIEHLGKHNYTVMLVDLGIICYSNELVSVYDNEIFLLSW